MKIAKKKVAALRAKIAEATAVTGDVTEPSAGAQEEPGTCLRAITLPVSHPLDRTWDEARALLGPAMRQSRELHNWVARQCVRLDCAPPVVGADGKRKLPPMPQLPTSVKRDGWSLYKTGRAVAPLLNAGTVAQIVTDVVGAYVRHRFAVFRGEEALRCYRSGILPARKQEADACPLQESKGGGLGDR